ncbi:hypothetical protein QBC46DRAFT_420645 [Diplogelasinospora grovesii]|uniref:NFX1-type zinc finger-containing protein 1 n=1 Tax=Diplogelasinospora grovesii TaxID=303347 RepID=A0AAN6MZS9_9PEZI|nr:hypothetical protein QBC46DRAFT_420645 [Diplogelasinospora grovesii]
MWGNNRSKGPSQNQTNKGRCWSFDATGSCKLGNRCKFAHITPTPQRGPPNAASPGIPSHNNTTRQPVMRYGKLVEWKRLLRQGSPGSRPTHGGRFFELGLELMEGDVGGSQEVIRLLVTEAGLSLIRHVTDHQIPDAGSGTDHQMPDAGLGSAKTRLWNNQLKPLFGLVTHPRVADSAVLELEVSALMNFLLGVNGTRLIRVYNFIIALVTSWPAQPASSSRMSAVELSLGVLTKIVDCNTTNMVNENFHALVTSFSAIVQKGSEAGEEFSELQATKYLHYIKGRLSVASGIPSLTSAPATPVVRESFVLRRDLPGHLSAEGRRHDNDHASITDVKIMPTFEEIVSPRGEYLPTNDPSQWHVPGIHGRLDREFRLLREDTIGQLRDAVRETLEAIRQSGNTPASRGRNGLRTYRYDQARIVDLEFSEFSGLEMVVRCVQPAPQKMDLKKRREWWDHSKRLQVGGLVCMLDARGKMVFCEVASSTLRTADDKAQGGRSVQLPEAGAAAKEKVSLADDGSFTFVSLQLIDAGNRELGQALRWAQGIGSLPPRYLVEFPGVLLASFKHTLAALQQMSRKPDLPFTDLLAPSTTSGESVRLNPPQYARKAGFTFNLKCVTSDRTGFLVSPSQNTDSEKLSKRSSLDPTQAHALLNTLSREISLIQGPPGTGKSYTGEKVIKVLLANKEKARLGPILCVCYTNHALDQLLEHLYGDGIKKIIRIGSRSKSDILQGLNLRVVAKGADRTKTEKCSFFEHKKEITRIVKESNDLLRQLSAASSLAAIKNFLAESSPWHHDQMFRTDDEGWHEVHHKRENAIEAWLQRGSSSETTCRPLEDLERVGLWDMTQHERRRLHRHWLESIGNRITTQLLCLHREFAKEKELRDRANRELDLRCLHEADIVGVTTTGLASNLDLLRKLRCKVLLCEEAGEVLEAHILTALLPSVEHAILIGDHMQLRPQIQNYELQSTNPRGEQYSLDMSLFERLVRPPHTEDIRLPYSVLETQRRMHPSISELVRSTLYPALRDSEHVNDYPEVKGLRRRLFWLHHEQPEAGAASQDPLATSHSNPWEIEMTAALVSHLVRQGEYSNGDIAVITPYLGQLHKLRRRMESVFEICLNDRDLADLEALEADKAELSAAAPLRIGKTTLLKSVRVATVDNFQGEEAKVVVISLVRSNNQNRCGFLSTSNRINVLLSRAKHGMYIIGNSKTYSNVPMWVDVISMMQKESNLGTALELQCPRHPATPILVSHWDHFAQFAPESGCNLPCDKRLRCGHSCTGRCHSDALHHAVKCLEKCPRSKKGCDHSCPRFCGDPCHDRCQVLLRDINLRLKCGHAVSSAHCWEAQAPDSIRCMVEVARAVPGCNHQVKVKCYEDVTAATFMCRAQCGHHRLCGHTCKDACFKCRPREDGKVATENHGICNQVCGRSYQTCRHSCQQTCHGEKKCGPCVLPCEARCSHSRCSKPCHEPCAPCAEDKCASSCPHSSCTMPCAAPCVWVPCSRRCEERLACGHQCPSLCGEPCPEPRFCPQCGSEDVKSSVVDLLEMKTYGEIDLDADPCIFPDCGHILAMTSMDGQMAMSDHYEMDDQGLPVGLRSSSKAFSMDEIKACSTCRAPLRNVSRYGRIVRRAMLDEATKKFTTCSNERCDALTNSLLDEREKLERTADTAKIAPRQSRGPTSGKLTIAGARFKQLRAVQEWVPSDRYASIMRLLRQIRTYAGEVRKEEQPFQRVADLVKHANRQNKTTSQFVFDEESVIQVRGEVLAKALALNCEIVILLDFLKLLETSGTAAGGVKPEMIDWNIAPQLGDCEKVIELAHDSVRPRQEVEGRVYYAKFCGISRALYKYGRQAKPAAVDPEAGGEPQTDEEKEKEKEMDKKLEEMKKRAVRHLEQAKSLMEKSASAAVLRPEVEAAEGMLRGEIFYQNVSVEEMRAVYAAMAVEFNGTGHWYTCANGHPFTIGECGMAMQRARCPECDAPVGGADHVSAEGVQHAAHIEELGRGFAGLRIGGWRPFG